MFLAKGTSRAPEITVRAKSIINNPRIIVVKDTELPIKYFTRILSNSFKLNPVKVNMGMGFILPFFQTLQLYLFSVH